LKQLIEPIEVKILLPSAEAFLLLTTTCCELRFAGRSNPYAWSAESWWRWFLGRQKDDNRYKHL